MSKMAATSITSYSDLLKVARTQHDAQRLLFVFVAAELPDGHEETEKEHFLAGEGGALTPVMCVDKLPAELGGFADLSEESQQTGVGWDIVFVAAMSGVADIAPNSDEAEKPLGLMVDAIKNGNIKNFLAFDKDGDLVRFF